MKSYLKNLKKKKKGFTLIELIIVLAIIAIISAIAIPNFSKMQRNAKAKADIATAKNVATAISAKISDGTLTVPDTGIPDCKLNTSPVATAVSDSFSTVPAPQLYTSGYFLVSADTNGNVTVKVQITSGGTTYTLYPTADPNYK